MNDKNQTNLHFSFIYLKMDATKMNQTKLRQCSVEIEKYIIFKIQIDLELAVTD